MKHLLLVLILVAVAQPAAADDSSALEKITDELGFTWDLALDGSIIDGTSDCFDGAMRLEVNGQPVEFKDAPSRDSKGNFAFTAETPAVRIIRIVLVSKARSAVRYLDCFERIGSRNPVVKVALATTNGGRSEAIVTNVARDLRTASSLGAEEFGLLMLQKSSRPCAAFVVASVGSEVKPMVERNRPRKSLKFSYELDLGRGEVGVIMTVLAQRRLDAPVRREAIEATLTPLADRYWLSTVPRELRGKLVNYSDAAQSGSVASEEPGDGEGGLPLEEVEQLVERYDLDRGEYDRVYLDEDASFDGMVTGPDVVEVTTRFGTHSIERGAVAAIAGGAGIGRAAAVYLRTGEVLVGSVSMEGMHLVTAEGITMQLDAAGLDLLVMSVAPHDGVPRPGTFALLETHDGNQLAIAPQPESALPLATPWGSLEVPFAELWRIGKRSSTTPGVEARLIDGSRFPCVFVAGALALKSPLVGDCAVEPREIASFRSYAGERARERLEADDFEPGGPFCRLIGDATITGTIALGSLHLVSGGSVSTIAPEKVSLISKADAEGPRFLFVLLSEDEVNGRLRETLLPIETSWGRLHVPVAHLEMSHRPSAEAGKDGSG